MLRVFSVVSFEANLVFDVVRIIRGTTRRGGMLSSIGLGLDMGLDMGRDLEKDIGLQKGTGICIMSMSMNMGVDVDVVEDEALCADGAVVVDTEDQLI